MPLSRDAHKEAMRSTIRAGVDAAELIDSFRWRRLTSEDIKVRRVLMVVHSAGEAARDVLDMMEENDGQL